MTSALYPKYKETTLSGGINLTSDTIKVVLVDLADYTYSGSHQFLSDVPSGARVATTAALTSKTVTNGTFDADNTTFPTATGDPSEAMILYKDTGSAATSNLICFIDTVTGPASLTVTPNGGNIDVTWAAGGIFSL